ncbi:helix-turn-helix transcriptional regulator, partial [Streptomyces sp. ISL-14]|nr:helix-turn-helix transcriptional regulator [Streptomyces sp. ISL-14]
MYREMAKRAGCSTTARSQAAAGEQLPSLAVVRAYARALDADPDEPLLRRPPEERSRHLGGHRVVIRDANRRTSPLDVEVVEGREGGDRDAHVCAPLALRNAVSTHRLAGSSHAVEGVFASEALGRRPGIHGGSHGLVCGAGSVAIRGGEGLRGAQDEHCGRNHAVQCCT